MVSYAYVVPLLPLFAFGLQSLFGRALGRATAWVGIACLAASTAVSLAVLAEVLRGAEAAVSWPWLSLGGATFSMGVRVGPLEAAMIAMVTFVSLMVEVYSVGYMAGDAKFNRFFAIVNLFVGAMLVVVLADNFLLLFAGWEIMGLASYLLIGHWYHDLANARAATKSFLVTRLGDIGLLIGIFVCYQAAGTLDFAVIDAGAASWAPGVATLAALLIFAGAVGKSAQVPLHVWLPDAMAGPTPVSALIHAATMVAAGVFLVARTYPVFEASGTALAVVAVVGGVTAFLAATVGTVQADIKKMLAYSTISQLGYMMLGLGVFGYAAALFHLLSHAFFKALLFLGSGSVIHAARGEQDMHRMGGLFRKLPLTGLTFIVGGLALAGIPPFAGYFSKDEVLLTAWENERWLFWLGAATAGITGFYIARGIYLTFFGRPRDAELYTHAHESPPVMAVPLVVLAVFAAFFGWLGSASLGRLVQAFLALPGEAEPEAAWYAAASTIALAAAGVVAGGLLYGAARPELRAHLVRVLRPVYVLFREKWYFDHLALGATGLGLAASAFVGWFDRTVVDGLVNAVAWFTGVLGQASRRLAVGDAQAYMLTMAGAVLVGLAALLGLGVSRP
ncbi:MAG: NADH-quinone oxidoreductase subunit L [Clostridia bacterium]|nr:NADH-quinone oxidoreductase subunit L [Clostridia bacterium]